MLRVQRTLSTNSSIIITAYDEDDEGLLTEILDNSVYINKSFE